MAAAAQVQREEIHVPIRAYELMIIVDTDVDDAAGKAVIDRVKEMVESDGGTVASTTDNWGRRRFAYEINHKKRACTPSWRS